MNDPFKELTGMLGSEHVVSGAMISDDFSHDEALTSRAVRPSMVVFPTSTAHVSCIMEVAHRSRIPVTLRGAGTGLSGAIVPRAEGLVVSFERMNEILEIDTANNVAVVKPGVTLEQLDKALLTRDLEYPVYPGEYSATIGGNIATNAGGMRAVRHGVTRHNVLGLEAVLPGGTTIRTGGKFVKASSGYDLGQLIIGSEGTLAAVTEVTVRLRPRPSCSVTALAPFADLASVARAIPPLVGSGLDPVILEYIDALAMDATMTAMNGAIGISTDVKNSAHAYLLVMLEGHDTTRLDADTQQLGELLMDLGAIDCLVLPPGADDSLLSAREKAFWLAKSNGVDDIIDIVVPRASIADFMLEIEHLGRDFGAWIAGAGHAGDGNIHLAVFLSDDEMRQQLMRRIFSFALSLGGAISAEHGIGRAKRNYFLELEDADKLALMRRIKAAFDPEGILNPGVLL